jgi:hypothetical protein
MPISFPGITEFDGMLEEKKINGMVLLAAGIFRSCVEVEPSVERLASN